MFVSKPVLAGLVIVLLAGALFALRSNAPLAAQDAGAAPLKIAVVNMAEVFEKMDARKAREDELNREKDALRDLVNEKAARAKAAGEALQKMEAEDPKRADLEQDLARLQAEIEIEIKKGQARLMKRQLRDRKELYGIIRDAVDKYGRENGLALVHKIDDKRISDNPVTQDQEIGARGILYRGDSVIDITDAITRALNSQSAP